MAPLLIHGNIIVYIVEGDSLKDHDRAMGGGARIIRKLTEAIKETRLYVTIHLDKSLLGRTGSRCYEPSSQFSPIWHALFDIYCAHEAENVVFSVIYDNPIKATVVGRAYVPVEKLLRKPIDNQLLLLVDEKGEPIGRGAAIRVTMQFFDVKKDRNWGRGIGSPKFAGLLYTPFDQRKGCKVTLYQDAHVSNQVMPEIPLSGGQLYRPHGCWEDIFNAINNAEHLIYIAGWSVYTEITLIRDSKKRKSDDETLGKLLKRKAKEGVTVLMLVWKDRTSVKLLKNKGLMATHDEETLGYFDGSEVNCVLCPRNPDKGQSVTQDLYFSAMFTHHQKIVVVDSALPGSDSGQRRIVSFLGGIDLCNGRYDTQSHSLFRTLDSVHHADFHQPNFTDASIDKGGPREPWHDIHSKLEGPVAWDVLENFAQRWRKQGGRDLLLPLPKLTNYIISPSAAIAEDDREAWNVQVFRSIDGGAALGLSEAPEDNIIERSIQNGYITAIRRAKDFIYIETQYFLGSSYAWKPDDIKVEEIGALHLIPRELSLKIVTKIKAGEEFRVYIVLPMWPEGAPESASVQAILDWQRRTMDMMYADIAQALRAKQIYDADPKDYLTFLCLANREVKENGEYVPQEHPEEDSDYKRAQENRRFMIYVHSKMMIVDDEYIIIGSANINQRSMDGARDSEIAMGAYQPNHLAVSEPARGQIHGFRMRLWYEHIGFADNWFLRPESLECIRVVNKIGERNWYLYSSESLELDLPGHLLMYPVDVTNTGEVRELPGTEFFPDTKARVLGTKSDYLPYILTT